MLLSKHLNLIKIYSLSCVCICLVVVCFWRCCCLMYFMNSLSTLPNELLVASCESEIPDAEARARVALPLGTLVSSCKCNCVTLWQLELILWRKRNEQQTWVGGGGVARSKQLPGKLATYLCGSSSSYSSRNVRQKFLSAMQNTRVASANIAQILAACMQRVCVCVCVACSHVACRLLSMQLLIHALLESSCSVSVSHFRRGMRVNINTDQSL